MKPILTKKLYGNTIVSSNNLYAIIQLKKPLNGFKKVISGFYHVIAFLHLPVGTLVHYDEREKKLRCDLAIVMGFDEDVKSCRSNYDYDFIYRPASIVQPKYKFDMDLGVCSSGIHFFLEYNDAKNYYL